MQPIPTAPQGGEQPDPMELAPHELPPLTPPERIESLTLTGYEETRRRLALGRRPVAVVLPFARPEVKGRAS